MAENIVEFNGVSADVSSATESQLMVVVPAGVNTGKIKVWVRSQSALSSQDFIITEPPVISSFSPLAAGAGMSITIQGTNFSSIVTDNVVKFNQVTALIKKATSTELIVEVPATTNSGKITLSVNGSMCSSAEEFTFLAGNWSEKATFPGSARWRTTGFTIGNKIYTLTGDDNKTLKEVWEYNTNTDIWTRKADFAGTERYSAVGFSINGKGYIGTGYAPINGVYERMKDFWEYDPTADTWRRIADFPGEARTTATGFAIGNKGYVGLGVYFGVGVTSKNDFWEYDPMTNTWRRLADFPSLSLVGGVAFSLGTRGYVGLGNGVNGATKEFWEYNPLMNEWTKKADFAGGARKVPIYFTINGKGYIGMGVDDGDVKRSDMWRYEPSTDTWIAVANFIGLHRTQGDCFSVANKGYIGFGFDGFQYKKDLWQFIP